MARCDVLIIGETRYTRRTLHSLRYDDVQVHRMPWLGHIGKSRREALLTYGGTAPYLCWVDADDEVVPGAIDRCVDRLERDMTLVGVYTHERRIDADGRQIQMLQRPEWSIEAMLMHRLLLHHLVVVRREAAVWAADEVNYGVGQLYPWYCRMLLCGRYALEPIIGYSWRWWDSSVQLSRRCNDQECHVTWSIGRHHIADAVETMSTCVLY